MPAAIVQDSCVRITSQSVYALLRSLRLAADPLRTLRFLPLCHHSARPRSLLLPGRRWFCAVKRSFFALAVRPSGVLRMDIQNNGAAPERVDFSKIKTSIPIPNLIEVQKKSYERFLQMDLLPNEREDIGSADRLQLGVSDLGFPRRQRSRVRRLFDRQLGVQVRQPERAASPAFHLPQLRRDHPHRSVPRRRRALPPLRHLQQERRHVLQQVRRPGRPATEIRHAGVPGARHDVRRAAEGHHPADGLFEGSRDAERRASATSRNRKSSSAKSR